MCIGLGALAGCVYPVGNQQGMGGQGIVNHVFEYLQSVTRIGRDCRNWC